MKKTLLLVFLSILLVNITAQENLSAGYIITNSNDTIYGDIDLRTPVINQQKCTFISENNQEQTYLPGNIKAYRYTNAGKFYISKNVTIENREYSLFAEYLVQGGLSLYYIEMDGFGYFLFEEDGNEPFYVTKRPDKIIDGKTVFDNKFRGILIYRFQNENPSFIKLIEKAKFDQKSMIAIAKQYNDNHCLNPDQESCTIFENKNPDVSGVSAKFSIYTGLQNTIYSGYRLDGKELFPTIGGQIFVYNPRWSQSFGALLDLSFSRMKDEYVPEKQWMPQVRHEIYTLSARIGLRYTYNKFRLKPSLEGGLSNTFIVKNNSTEFYESANYELDYRVRKYHIGGYLGVGLEYNTLKTQSVFVRFIYDLYAKSDRSQSGATDHIKVWQVRLGYTF